MKLISSPISPTKNFDLDLSKLDVIELQDGSKKNIPNNLAITNPLPMQYLGSKSRISKWILNSISENLPHTQKFVDLFAGTGAVAMEANLRGYDVVLNDIQPYSYAVLKCLFEKPNSDLVEVSKELKTFVLKRSNLFRGSRKQLESYLEEEDNFINCLQEKKFNWEKYKKFCGSTPRFNNNFELHRKNTSNNYNLFSWYYPNTYFGIRQCLEIDTIRDFADRMDGNSRAHIIACVISTMTYNVSSTTHLAQFIKPNNGKQAQFLLHKRSKSILDSVLHRLNELSKSIEPRNGQVFNLDYLDALKKIKPNKSTIIYADPPYFKEHYSRYYHILDTFYLYDYPELALNPQTKRITEGKYRVNRNVSRFGLKSKAAEAFEDLLSTCKRKGFSVAISYANTSLIDKKKMKEIIKNNGYKIVSLKEKSLMHSAQGQGSNKIALEYLYLIVPEDDKL